MKGTEKQIKFATDIINKIDEAEKITLETMKEYGYTMDDIVNAHVSHTGKRKVRKMLQEIIPNIRKAAESEDASEIIDAWYKESNHLVINYRTI